MWGKNNSLGINEIPSLVCNLEGYWKKLRGKFLRFREGYHGEVES